MSAVERYIEFIKEAELLKGVLRTAWQSTGRQESTGEHSWRLALFAAVMLEEFPELDGRKTLIMCLIHDLGEIYDGDISAALHPDAGKKAEDEGRAVERVCSLLPEGLGTKYMNIWLEYANASSKEALFVKALDKAETIIQHNQGKNSENFDYGFNLEYGKEYFRGSDELEELRRKLDDETRMKMTGKER
ncbi:HD domain-containing protein [Clostridium sp. MCC353]|uniref:HD domain-containing protein n=1 Tax=Clostridium sp. MCC353 TaxID=2592646 RepID=UPI001C02119B|nr:HD domain-containing protein [Clostridium sp. MCC353]MBT9778897.1 HD domain-containing protein [Clostridium sp. MCC353]